MHLHINSIIINIDVNISIFINPTEKNMKKTKYWDVKREKTS